MSQLRRKSSRTVSVIIGILIVVAISGFYMGKATKELKNMGSLYVMIDEEGIPIDYVPLHARYPSQAEAFEFVEKCLTMMFDVDALSYREQTLRFLDRCMTISDGTSFVYAFRDSGFYELIQAGAVLQMDVIDMALSREFVHNGRLTMRFDIKGLVYIMREASSSTELELSVVVRRQNVHQYKTGLTISQVIW